MKILFNDIKDNFLDYTKVKKKISQTIDSRDYILGKSVFDLEKKLSTFVGAKYCITTSSGTDALLIALLSLNLKKNSEVITPGFSYISSAEVIVRAGLKPVFVDVDSDTALIDVSKLEKKITKKTSCIIVVSLFGQLPDIKALNQIKKKYKVPIIEDGAQSFGSKFEKSNSCNIFDVGCTSFFPTKSLGCFGDGGAIFTSKKKLYLKFKQIRQHGQKKKYYFDIQGLNARLDTIQAVVLIEKLKKLKINIYHKKILFEKYKRYLSKEKNVKFIKIKDNHSICYPLLNIIINKRKNLINFLNKKGIPTNIYYPLPLNEQKVFRNIEKNKIILKNCKKLSKTILSLPFHLSLKESQIKYIANNIKKFYQNN
jgi:UDP-2-acetamido-2-deoxy-ribo-hexuluronate aminotransferase